MNNNRDKDFYINIAFTVFIFVITFFLFKDYIFKSSTLLFSGLAGFIGGFIAIGLGWLLRQKGLIIKVIIVVFFIGAIVFVGRVGNENNVTDVLISNEANSNVAGTWSSSEAGDTLQIAFNDGHVKMKVSSDESQLEYEYEIEGQKIDFFDDENTDFFQWIIVKWTIDSLIVKDTDQLIKFSKNK